MEIALEKTCRPSPCGGTSRLSLAPPALPPRRPPPAPTSWLRPHAWASIRSRAVWETSCSATPSAPPMIPSCAWPAKTVGQSGACGRAANSNSGMKAIMPRCLLCGLEHPHAMEGESQIAALPIKSIHLRFQGEECLDQDTVEKYVEALRQKEEILPVRVCYDGECYWLADGFHRLRAARTLRRRKIKAEIVQGTYADMEACWRAVIQAINDDLLK